MVLFKPEMDLVRPGMGPFGRRIVRGMGPFRPGKASETGKKFFLDFFSFC